jgi:hypothetical protein
MFHPWHDNARYAARILLADISSNAVVARPLGETAPQRRPQALIEYRASLNATRELDFDIGLSGHGRAFTDHRALIDHRLAAHDRRAAQILWSSPITMLTRGLLKLHGYQACADTLRA